MTDRDPWDVLAPNSSYDVPEPLEWYDADNVFLAEPVMLKYLTSQTPDPKSKRVLDFGCGSGQFAHRLQSLGYDAEGIDSAPNMIKAAKAWYGSAIKFTVGGSEIVSEMPAYDAISSIMVLQFIPDYVSVVGRLAAALKPGGLLLLAVFNPAFISDWIKARDPSYVGFDSVDNPTEGALLFGEVTIPTYIRTAKEYTEVAKESGLSLLGEEYPPFTEVFLQKYPVNGPTQHSEHLILIYRKSL